MLLAARPGAAQQFTGDNQWVAPHGVGTFLLTVGQEYSNFMAVAALLWDARFSLLTVGLAGFGRAVAEAYAAEGAQVAVTTPAFPGVRLTGVVDVIEPQLDEATRTVGIVALVDNPDRVLRPGDRDRDHRVGTVQLLDHR